MKWSCHHSSIGLPEDAATSPAEQAESWPLARSGTFVPFVPIVPRLLPSRPDVLRHGLPVQKKLAGAPGGGRKLNQPPGLSRRWGSSYPLPVSPR